MLPLGLPPRRTKSACDWVFCCCRHAGTVLYVRCSWCCQGPLFFYSMPVLLLIYPPLHFDIALYSTVLNISYCTMTTCVQVLLFNSCQLTTMILYYSTHTDCITLVLNCCMTCTVHWCCTIAWHVRYIGAVPLHGMYCKQVGWCCSCHHLYCCSCSYIPNLTLTSLLCCALLIKRHARSGVVFLICCIWMSNNFFLLDCLDLVYKAMCPLKSSIWSPASDSQSFEWIKSGQSTGIGSVWQLSVHMLKCCKHMQDYSYFNQQMSYVPSLSPASWKEVTMDEVYLFKDGTNKFTCPPGKKPNRQFRIQVPKILSSHSCAVSKFPLQKFSTWFQDLGLSKLMSHNKGEDCD